MMARVKTQIERFMILLLWLVPAHGV